ncbi:CopD family protein [Photobacterium sp. ZSDE20]|uniref:CopD family protein n=1 Tax=Photobacterium pectinilyticum TaxID=2906793 RepID=A0ABT1N5Q7_9GAMM|nr:CopD family protein [Photobacterium sp. ZSDE20]MCQ1060078.1 CopD family protein [Photobacterium sp. ZSDE20]MDD1827257.1 CopD family protein [Photobacterium sp. ZSDE20]
MFGLLLSLHIISATIWTGGHIVLSLVILPSVLKNHNPQQLTDFEQVYEKIGMPALIVQVVTGLMLAYRMLPDITLWFDTSIPIAHGIMAKLFLLAITILFALDARFRVIPKLSPDNLWDMAWHIIPVTVASVLFALVGVSFRVGWLV